MNLRTSVQQHTKFRPRLSSGKHKGNAHFRTYKSSVRFTFNKTWENLACVCKAYYLTLPFQNNKYQMKSWKYHNNANLERRQNLKRICFSKSTSGSSINYKHIQMKPILTRWGGLSWMFQPVHQQEVVRVMLPCSSTTYGFS